MTTSNSSRSPTDLDALHARIWALPRPTLLAFDVDGTLAPIVDDPAAARVPAATATALRKLAKRQGLRVALVTGRDGASLRRLVRVPGAYRALEHGALVVGPGQRVPRRRLSAQAGAKLRSFERWVEEHALSVGGELERKPRSRALHVRLLARRDPALARRLLKQAAAAAQQQGLHPRGGRAVLEAELARSDKGTALRQLVALARARSVVYVGDDLTDYPAIAEAVAQGGLGLFVRSKERRGPRTASASLGGPAEVAQLVQRLASRP